MLAFPPDLAPPTSQAELQVAGRRPGHDEQGDTYAESDERKSFVRRREGKLDC